MVGLHSQIEPTSCFRSPVQVLFVICSCPRRACLCPHHNPSMTPFTREGVCNFFRAVMTPPQAGKIRDFLHITPQVRNEVSQLQSLSPSLHQAPSSHILGIWGWGEVDDGYRGDCERWRKGGCGSRRKRRKRLKCGVGTKCHGWGFCPETI